MDTQAPITDTGIEPHTPTRAGMVAIVGLPNAGKSTLLNRLVEQKLSIVTSAAQTTRERVVGIDSRDGVQMIFLDTPGIVRPAYLLHESMLGIVEQSLRDADVTVLLIDGTQPPPEIDDQIRALLFRPGSALIVAINKVDTAPRDTRQMLTDWILEQGIDTGKILEISASAGEGIGELRHRITEGLPESPFLYPEDELSTQSVRFFVSELIRETVFEMYRDEIPYSSAVRVDEFREGEQPIFIRATVYVERSSQKGILIGKNGEAIKKLGRMSRKKIEKFLDGHVYLDLWVKVLPKWRKKSEELKRFGFPVPDN